MNFKMLKRWWKTVDNSIQDFDKAALAAFGCKMCHISKNAHNLSHGYKPRPCIWKHSDYGALQYYGCDTLRRMLDDFLKETR